MDDIQNGIQSCYKNLTDEVFNKYGQKINTFGDEYIYFLNKGKTERECVAFAKKMLDFVEECYQIILKIPLHLDKIFIISALESNVQKPKSKITFLKEKIVEADPTEKNIRKALNLGHTLGHAIESLAMEQRETILHGYAVAWGIIGELYLSFMKCNFPKEHLQQTVQFIRQYYGNALVDCKQYERLYQLMMHDKKNSGNNINFTLLGNIGDIRINQQATKNEIFEMLDFLTFNI